MKGRVGIAFEPVGKVIADDRLVEPEIKPVVAGLTSSKIIVSPSVDKTPLKSTML